MSKLLKNIREAHIQGQDRAMPAPQMCVPFAESSVARNGQDHPTIDRSRGYALRATVGVDFWANQAQYSDARKAAVRSLVVAMYIEVFQAIDHIHGLLYAGDLVAAHQRLDELSNELLEGQDL